MNITAIKNCAHTIKHIQTPSIGYPIFLFNIFPDDVEDLKKIESIDCSVENLEMLTYFLRRKLYSVKYFEVISILLTYYPEYASKIQNLPGYLQILASPKREFDGNKADNDITFKYIDSKYIW